MSVIAKAADTQLLTPGVASATTQLQKPATNANYVMQVMNRDATVTAFLRFGTSSGMPAATVADLPVAPNDKQLIDIPLGTTHVAIIGMVNAVATAATNGCYLTAVYAQSAVQ